MQFTRVAIAFELSRSHGFMTSNNGNSFSRALPPSSIVVHVSFSLDEIETCVLSSAKNANTDHLSPRCIVNSNILYSRSRRRDKERRILWQMKQLDVTCVFFPLSCFSFFFSFYLFFFFFFFWGAMWARCSCHQTGSGASLINFTLKVTLQFRGRLERLLPEKE